MNLKMSMKLILDLSLKPVLNLLMLLKICATVH